MTKPGPLAALLKDLSLALASGRKAEAPVAAMLAARREVPVVHVLEARALPGAEKLTEIEDWLRTVPKPDPRWSADRTILSLDPVRMAFPESMDSQWVRKFPGAKDISLGGVYRTVGGHPRGEAGLQESVRDALESAALRESRVGAFIHGPDTQLILSRRAANRGYLPREILRHEFGGHALTNVPSGDVPLGDVRSVLQQGFRKGGLEGGLAKFADEVLARGVQGPTPTEGAANLTGFLRQPGGYLDRWEVPPIYRSFLKRHVAPAVAEAYESGALGANPQGVLAQVLTQLAQKAANRKLALLGGTGLSGLAYAGMENN